MSEDVKMDLLKAIQNAQNNGTLPEKVAFPDPVVLKHSLDNGVTFPPPTYRQDGKDGNNN